MSAERGSALLLALLVLAVLLLMGSAFLSVSLSERSIAVNETNSGKSFNVAEAGVEHTRALVPATDVDALLLAGGTLFSGQALDGGTYTVNVTNNIGPTFPRGTVPVDPGGANDDTDEYLVVSSTGNFRMAERTIEVVIEKEILPFEYGLYGKDLLQLSGSGLAQTDVGSNGDIQTIGGCPAATGNADAVGTVIDPSCMSGTSSNGNDPKPFDDIACPATPFGGVPAGGGVIFNAAGDILLTGGTDKTFAGGTYYYRDFRKVGNGKMVIPVGQKVTIFISGQLDISGGGFVNHNGSAAFLQLWACGSDTSNWSFSGNDEVWLTLYAPRHNVTLTGSGDKHGGFVGAQLTTSGSADIYYDAGLNLPTGLYVTTPGTWTESGL
jgi:hypothetical protein